jgi:hypothetical protein
MSGNIVASRFLWESRQSAACVERFPRAISRVPYLRDRRAVAAASHQGSSASGGIAGYVAESIRDEVDFDMRRARCDL